MTTALTRRWTREEYHRAAELGLFRPDERLELIRGEIRIVCPQSRAHVRVVERAAETLAEAFGAGHYVMQEKPLALPDDSEPEPDITVLPGTGDDYLEHPTAADALLIVEVSLTTLENDRTEKAALYARAGIPEYWILNVRDGRLEVHREPAAVAAEEFGYLSQRIYTRDMVVAPSAAPQASVYVRDLLPRNAPGA